MWVFYGNFICNSPRLETAQISFGCYEYRRTYFPKTHLRNQKLHPGLPLRCRGQNTWATSHCYSRYISRELGKKWSSWVSNQHPCHLRDGDNGSLDHLSCALQVRFFGEARLFEFWFSLVLSLLFFFLRFVID